MPNFFRNKQFEEGDARKTFNVKNVRRTTNTPNDGTFSGTPTAPETAKRLEASLPASRMYTSNATSSVTAEIQPVARDHFQHQRSSSSVQTSWSPNPYAQERSRYYSGLPVEDREALARGDEGHNLIPYTSEASISKYEARKALRPRIGTEDPAAQLHGSAQHNGQPFIQEHRHSTAVTYQPTSVQSAAHSRSFTDPAPQLSSKPYGSLPQESAPQLPPATRGQSLSHGFEQYLHTISVDHAASSAAARLPLTDHIQAVRNQDDHSERGRPLHRPVSRPVAQQPSSQSSATSSRVRSPFSKPWTSSSFEPAQPIHTRNASGTGFFHPQPSHPSYAPLASNPPSPISAVSSRVRSPRHAPSPATPLSAASTPSSAEIRHHQHNPNKTFDDMLAPHKDGKGETYWDSPNAKPFQLSKDAGRNVRTASFASNDTAASRSSFAQVKDKIAAMVRGATGLGEASGEDEV